MKGMMPVIDTTADDMTSPGWEFGDGPREPEVEVAKPAIRLRGRRGAPPPAWAEPVVRRIMELDALLTVDPHGSRPLNFDDVADALEFLTRVMRDDTCPPWIGRLSSGGVELSWKHADVEAEAVFDRLRSDAELIVSVGEREWDAPAEQADSLFATVVERLSSSYVEHASA